MATEPLNYAERMQSLRRKLREAYNKAYRADVRWNELNDAFKERHRQINERRVASGRIPMTEQEMRDEMEANFALTDAFGEQGWWREQAQLIAQTILAEEAVHRALRAEVVHQGIGE